MPNDASEQSSATYKRAQWAAQSFLLIVPFTAILHNSVFYRGTCILNTVSDETNDYNWGAVVRLFQKDPSIWLGLALAVFVFILGLRGRETFVRQWVPVFMLSTLPLSFWVWDIPLAGQPICRCCHDLRWSLPLLGPIRSRTVYLFSLVLFATLASVRVWSRHRRVGSAKITAA